MRAVVLGGGYAGLVAVRHLETRLPDEAEIVLVDETGEHLVQHELHRVVRRPAFADHVSLPLSDLVDRAEVVVGRVASIDREGRTVTLASGTTIGYDAAAVCLGGETDFHGLPGVAERATPLKRLEHAASIRQEFEGLLERGGGTVVVGGAGLSGIQVAGELAAFARDEGAADAVDVVLVEQAETVAPALPPPFREAVRAELAARDVVVETGTVVAEATGEALRFESGAARPYDQFVWTGGIRGPDALGGERPSVRATLALDDRTFVVGDAARVVDAEGRAVPASAQAAVRAAKVAARNVARVLADGRGGFRPRLEKWTFDSPGWVVTVGDTAVAQIGPEVVTGPLATLAKDAGVTYLAGNGSLRAALDVLRGDPT